MTTCLTTDSAGVLGNSEIKSDKEWAECSEKDQKLLEITRNNLVQPFKCFRNQKRIIAKRLPITSQSADNSLKDWKIVIYFYKN